MRRTLEALRVMYPGAEPTDVVMSVDGPKIVDRDELDRETARAVREGVPLSGPEALSPLVTVCSECLRASCWHGEFLCDDAVTASTVEKSVSELEALGLEHPDHWKTGERG